MQHLQSNTTLQGGKYKIERVLGQGGFGITYLAYQVPSNHQVAIKELFIGGEGQAINDRKGNLVVVTNSANQASFNQQKEKFKKEARRLENLNHPNLVKVHEFFEENGTVYYVMDYIEGESLRTKLNRDGNLSESLVLKYLQQLLPALDTAHRQSIWHLDIKPENIMVDRYGHVTLIDFGASKHIEQNKTLTTSLALAYTPGYCPPELADLTNGGIDNFVQALKDIGPWTDIYALGATMYNLITDSIPPSSNRLYREGRNAFVFPTAISSSTKDLIIWMMMPDREKRPQRIIQLEQFHNNHNSQKRLCDSNNEKTLKEQFYCHHSGYVSTNQSKIITQLFDNMVFVRGGTFMMGKKVKWYEDKSDQLHQVTLSDYYIGKYQVTQSLWRYIMGNNPSVHVGESLPVDCVSWDDCQLFIKKLNEKIGKCFRLPTEAEWEFAARGGTQSRGYKYSGSNEMESVAWNNNNSGGTTHEVGLKLANEIGIYDMSGNVWEWCQDTKEKYGKDPQINPLSNSSDYYNLRVFRGGSFIDSDYCVITYRNGFNRQHRCTNYGFRLAITNL